VNSYVLVVRPAIQGENFLPIDDPAARDVTIGGIPAGRTFTFGLMAVTTHGNSPAAELTLLGTRLKLSTKRLLPRTKTHARLKAHLTQPNGAAVPGRRVTLYRKLAGKKGFHRVATKKTSHHGLITFRPRQKRGATYFVAFPAKVSGLLGSRSSKHHVGLRH
jgi:hypothetical protein